MIRLISLQRDNLGVLHGQVECDDKSIVDAVFSVEEKGAIHIVSAEPYILGDGYVRTPEESRRIADAVVAFDVASNAL